MHNADRHRRAPPSQSPCLGRISSTPERNRRRVTPVSAKNDPVAAARFLRLDGSTPPRSMIAATPISTRHRGTLRCLHPDSR